MKIRKIHELKNASVRPFPQIIYGRIVPPMKYTTYWYAQRIVINLIVIAVHRNRERITNPYP